MNAATKEPRITERDGWFYVETNPGGNLSYFHACGGDPGIGSGRIITRFSSEEAAIYYIRAEDFRTEINRLESAIVALMRSNIALVNQLHKIPSWIRRLFAKPEPPEEYPNG